MSISQECYYFASNARWAVLDRAREKHNVRLLMVLASRFYASMTGDDEIGM